MFVEHTWEHLSKNQIFSLLFICLLNCPHTLFMKFFGFSLLQLHQFLFMPGENKLNIKYGGTEILGQSRRDSRHLI
jgi:hypothetical protein